MTFLRTHFILPPLLSLAACVSMHPFSVPEIVGALQPPAVPTTGSLIVYSATERASADPADYEPNSDYQLYSQDGRLLRSVNNRNAPFGREPATVALPVGHYTVTANAPRWGLLSIPIVIDASQTTVVDLINQVVPPASTASARFDTKRWVRLPDGQVIGSKAQ